MLDLEPKTMAPPRRGPSPMMIDWTTDHDVALVRIRGDADAVATESLSRELEAVVRLEPRTVRMDLSGVRFMGPSAMGALAHCAARIRRLGGRVVVTGVADKIATAMRRVRLDRLIDGL